MYVCGGFLANLVKIHSNLIKILILTNQASSATIDAIYCEKPSAMLSTYSTIGIIDKVHIMTK